MADFNSDKAVKNAWRFIGLVYLLMLTFFLAFPIGRLCLPANPMSAMLLTVYVFLALIVAFCFGMAAVGWALWSFHGRRKGDRGAALIALLTAILTTLLLGAYMLVFTGTVRL